MLEIIAFIVGHVTGFDVADERNIGMRGLAASALASGVLALALTGLLGFGTLAGVYDVAFLFADATSFAGVAAGSIVSLVAATVGTYVGYGSEKIIDDLRAAIGEKL